MKVAKRMVYVMLAAMLLFCMTGCNGREKNEAPKGQEEVPNAGTAGNAEGEKETGNKTEGEKETGSKTEGGTEVSNNGGNGETNVETGSRILVAYFSATGTTKKLAEYAAEVMGADLYEIVPQVPYTDADLNWNDKKSRTSIEMNDKSIKPAISGSVANMAQYEIVFLGYPIWWGDAPHIMDTFMESYDFSGKTIVPFCTSGSSGIGSSAKNLHAYTDKSVKWLDGARLKSNSSKADMADWVKGLSLGIELQ